MANGFAAVVIALRMLATGYAGKDDEGTPDGCDGDEGICSAIAQEVRSSTLVLHAGPDLNGTLCVDLTVDGMHSFRITSFADEVVALKEANLPEDSHHVRERIRGAVWRLDDFDAEVMHRQTAADVVGEADGWPPHQQREQVAAVHRRCAQLAAEATHSRSHSASGSGATGSSIGWVGCHNESKRCYLPKNESGRQKDRDGPRTTPPGVNSLEEPYTESMLRTGSNSPPCCRHHLLEMLFNFKALMTEAGLQWQIGSATLISALRVGEILPWEFDADVYVAQPGDSGGLWNSLFGSLGAEFQMALGFRPRPKTEQERIEQFPYLWVLRKLRRLGYAVKMASPNYWMVHYSKENPIYIDVVWPTVEEMNDYYGGRSVRKTARLYGVEFPYFVDLAIEYGHGWVLPNRNNECTGRCSTMATRLSRLQCACLCAREPSRVADARWHLDRWVLESYFNATRTQRDLASLARSVVEEAAGRTVPPATHCLEFPEGADAPPERLQENLAAQSPNFAKFVQSLQAQPTTDKDKLKRQAGTMSEGTGFACPDLKGFCFSWFGDLVRAQCAATCEFPLYEDPPFVKRFAAAMFAQFSAIFSMLR